MIQIVTFLAALGCIVERQDIFNESNIKKYIYIKNYTSIVCLQCAVFAPMPSIPRHVTFAEIHTRKHTHDINVFKFHPSRETQQEFRSEELGVRRRERVEERHKGTA